MSHHTPGPWVSKIHHYSNCEVFDESGDMIATVYPTAGVTGGIGPMVANTHLVAAAPKLLEALKGLRDHAYHMAQATGVPVPSELVASFESAIAKAEGKV